MKSKLALNVIVVMIVVTIIVTCDRVQAILTASFGKVFHNPIVNGIDVYADHWTKGNSLKYHDQNGNNQCDHNAIYCDIPEESATDYKMTSSLINFINENVDKKWFIAAGFLRPHLSNAVPIKYVNGIDFKLKFPNTTLITPKTNLNYYDCDDVYNKKMLFRGKLQPMINRQRKTSSDIAEKFPKDTYEFIKWYTAAILFIDSQLLRIVDCLIENKIYNKTIIIFTSDHGWNSGDNGMWCKNCLYNKVTSVPLLIKGIRPVKNKVIDEYTQLLDIYPTILDFLGVKKKPKLDGKSLVPLMYQDKGTGGVAITMYVRCNNLGEIPGQSCMSVSNKNLKKMCKKMPSIKYIGFSVRMTHNDYNYEYITWKPFNEVRECKKLFGYNVPVIVKNSSSIDWETSLDTLLFKNGNLVDEPEIEKYFENIFLKNIH